ncbi:MAG TPA: MgtC/SapB family protein [Candidatus Binatia bacterium]|nr:MgtC/SapB family protein [Candidatus Binatia bacterium]
MSLGEFTMRVAAALIFGAVIGLERQWHHRLAGLRTNSLVATGAAAFVALSGMATGDNAPTRIAAQVVSGIGFLGAGVIFREGFSVRGLNTAATLWCAAAVGSLSGSGFLAAAAIATLMVGATNVLLRPVSHLVARGESKAEMEIWYLVVIACRKSAELDIRAAIMRAAAEGPMLVRAIRSGPGADHETVRLDATLVLHGQSSAIVEKAAALLRSHPGVSAVSWEISGEAQPE